MIELLRKVELFESLNTEQTQSVLGISNKETYPSGMVLFRENDPGSAFFIVLNGSIKIYKANPSGEEKILSVFRAGESFGELSLIDGKPRSATAQTLEETTVLVISGDGFMELLKSNFDITQSIMAELCRRLRDTNQHVHDLTFLDAKTRVIKNLITLANRHGSRKGSIIAIPLALNFDELSQMAGVAKNVLTQVIRDLEERQILRLTMNEFTLDLTKLRA